MNKFAQLAEILFKAGQGEGAHGGHVIGHTKSGKPIYASSSHPEHANFSPQEHTEAMNHHYEIWSKTQEKINGIRQKRPNWNPPKQVSQFLQHHHTQMQMHQNRANRGMARQAAPKQFGVQSGTAAAKHPYNTPQNIHKGLNEIEVPMLAFVVIISPDRKKVLLGKRAKDGEWESPGGHADVGESPEDVAIRECFEEFSVPLRRNQLEPLPMMYNKHMVPAHTYMAVVDEEQIKNISVEDDPSEEHTKWKWFKLDEALPEPMEDNRFNLVIHAKMRLAGITEMKKSYVPLDDLEGMSQMHTTEFAEESSHSPEMANMLTTMMKDYKPGDVPVQIALKDSMLHLVKVDDGIYSGFVKKIDKEGLEEAVANIDKMTIPSMIQFLRAKQLVREEMPVAKPSGEDEIRNLRILLETLVPKTEIIPMIYVSMDGDNIGNRVAQAEAENDEQRLIEMSHKIEAGQSVFRTWVQTVGGTIIESGGDEGLSKVPENALEKIEMFRSQYMSVSGATVTVGVGRSISEATRARELGKLKGKNRVEIHGPTSDTELKALLVPKDEAQKIIESGVLKLVKSVEGLQKAMDLSNLIKDAAQELSEKTETDIEMETAKKWAARAIAAAKLGRKDMSEDFAHECLEHAALVKDYGKTVKRLQRIMDKQGVKFDTFSKGKALPIGSVRVWNGQHYRKEASGHWMPVAGMGGPTPDQTAAPSKAPSIEEKPQPAQEVKPEGPKPANRLKHLHPKEGMGGHVTAHSRDLKNAIENGPISIISAGRNNSMASDRGMTDDQISERSKKLEQELKDAGLKYMKVKGKYNGGVEDSFLVFHADPEKMNELGKKFNQDSVIHSNEGKNRLHFTTGENEGKHHKGEGHEIVPDEAKDNFTEATTGDGKKVRFNLGLDFGKLHEKA